MLLCHYLLLCGAVMTSKFSARSKSVLSNDTRSKVLPKLSKKDLGDLVPRRGGQVVPIVAVKICGLADSR
jgi:hypothetical protein